MATSFTNQPFEGQFDISTLRKAMDNTREQRLARRQAYLDANPTSIPCSIPACEGIVSRQFVRGTIDGQPFGFCPRVRIHQLLAPELFPPRPLNPRRSTPAEWAGDNVIETDETPAEPETPAKPRSRKEAVTA